MTVETGTTISQLDKNWPLGSDDMTEGDDHLRLIKSVLKTQFPGAGGQGFSKPITSTEDEINSIGQNKTDVDAKIKNIEDAIKDMQDSLNDKFFPVGHLLITTKKADPASYGYPGSWQQLTDAGALRVVTDGAGQTSGSDELDIPLPKHSHDMDHSHYIARVARTGSYLSGDVNACVATRGTIGSDREYELSVGASSGTANAGRTGSPIEKTKTGEAGVDDITINVAGKQFKVYAYKRIS